MVLQVVPLMHARVHAAWHDEVRPGRLKRRDLPPALPVEGADEAPGAPACSVRQASVF